MGNDMMHYYPINDVAKETGIETHVLRYWEEELGLNIERNAQGHRIYSQQDIETFQYIRKLKEDGLQLKAIRKKVHEDEGGFELESMGNKTEIAAKICMILTDMTRQAIREEQKEFLRGMKQEMIESVAKEMEYQFRMQQERQEEHDRKLDELLMQKRKALLERNARGGKKRFGKKKLPQSTEGTAE